MKNIIRFAMSALLAVGCSFLSNAQVGYEASTNQIAQNAKYATALGSHEIVDAGTYSVVMGFGNKVSNNKMAFAFGDSNEVSGLTSFSFGRMNLTSGDFSYSLGISNNTKSSTSFAIGITNTIENNASNSIAIGSNIINKGYQSITIGHGAGVSKALENNTGGIMFGSYSTKPTLFISRAGDYYKTGKVGIGNVTDPQAKLHIKADNYSYDGEDADILLEPTRADKKAAVYFRDKDNSISVSGNNKMYFNAGEYNFVNGVIRAEEVVVELMKDWPDYVFNDDYQLTSLDKVKKYIDDNGHLPGVPSAGQVSEKGVKLGEINTKLLEKIEELTLYIIQQEERIQALENKLDSITKN